MRYIDFHCDTLTKAFTHNVEDIWSMPFAMADIERLQKANVMAQFFAVYLWPRENVENGEFPEDDIYISRLTEILQNTIVMHSDDMGFATNVQMLNENEKNSKISAFLTIEDGRSVNGDLNKIKRYYDLGVRLITLTWNFVNCFGHPNSFDNETMQKGLTPFGKEAIEYMNEIGMIIDVSHLSDGGFYDVVNISKKPFIASHSNCRALSPHPRNMTDDMIKILAEKGGIMGLNFAPAFLNENISSKNSTVDDMVNHIMHMINVGGIECVSIGTDFDGINGEFEIGEPTKLTLLFDRLQKEGINEDNLEKIAYKNAVRVITQIL